MPDLKLQVGKRIREFDPLSLLLVLKRLGYSLEQILFRSHPSICSQDALFEEIRFRSQPSPHVVVSVNMGLLGAQTSLPSYFLKRMDRDDIDSARFVEFIQFFDHPLLFNFFRSIYPEVDARVFPDYEENHRRQLLMLGLRSPVTMHWMFHLVFPELDVRVEKAVLQRTLETRPFILGKSNLGRDSVLGRTFAAPIHGLRVHLFSDSEFSPDGTPWVKIIGRRLDDLIFPLLRAVGVELEIFLILRGQKSWARLKSGSYLGYDAFKGAREKQRRLLVFSGNVLE